MSVTHHLSPNEGLKEDCVSCKFKSSVSRDESIGALKVVSIDSHKALLDAAAICMRLSREAGQKRDQYLASGNPAQARCEDRAVSACLDCGEAILALVAP